MLSISTRLELNYDDTAIVDSLMNRWSAAYHTALNRLNDGESKQSVVQLLKKRFNLDYRYAYTAFVQAKAQIDCCEKLGTDPQDVIFGGKRNFRQLQKRHLDESKRALIKERYREVRRFNLWSIGETERKGNDHLRIEGNTLRINVGNRKYIYATIHTKDKRWEKVNHKLYTVRILKRSGKYYAHFSFEEVGLPAVAYKFDDGCIAIDLNAKPAHIAWVELDRDGNLKSRGEIPTPMLYDQRTHVRDYHAYVYAKQLVAICAAKNKGLILEKLSKLPTGSRATSNFCYAKLTKVIEIVCARGSVATKQVWAAYTSMIGCLKYAPINNLSRHTAAAIVIGRRGLGLKDQLPKYLDPLRAPHKLSSAHRVSAVGVTRWKKEANLLRDTFGVAYKVCRTALLTRQRSLTGKSGGPSWSMLKRFVLSGTDARFDGKLGPPSVGGLRRKKRRRISLV